jgi:hypothetical protein
MPLDNCIAPNGVEPLLNVMLPVGIGFAEAGETLAVNVTLDPRLACVEETVSVVVVVFACD